MFILKKGHQPGVYVPLRALFLVSKLSEHGNWVGRESAWYTTSQSLGHSVGTMKLKFEHQIKTFNSFYKQ